MNKPATKEPSMDEILSSIRQIIADDDASSAPAPVSRSVAAPASRAPVPATPQKLTEPLALSAAQMIPKTTPRAPDPEPERAPAVATDFASMLSDTEEPEADPMAEMLGGEAELLDPEDVAFDMDFEAEPQAEPEPPPLPVVRAAEPPARPAEPPRAAQRPTALAQAAPMPDPTLSQDLAEQLLAPATDAAVQGAMTRLGALANTGIGSMTVEGMIRDMLRPMLKDWLDENLPSLVEGMVEKEISRISRGVK